MMTTIFWVSVLLILYTYIGYPILLGLFSIFFKKPVKRGKIFPTVTVIIPVHDEEKQIARKIENCLAFDYPREKLKILVASDYSSDGTDEIVEAYKEKGVRLERSDFRGGKVVAQNIAIRHCDSDILVFTDVAIMMAPDAVRTIVKNFNDESVGAVSCRDMVLSDERAGLGEKSYIGYDMLVRKFASKTGSIIGVTGGFYAVRASLAKGGWNPAFPPDFYVALRCLKKGYRVIEDDRVKAFYKTAAKPKDEFSRKVRTINRGMVAFFFGGNPSLANPARHGMVAIQLLSHKLMRWLSPLFFAVAFWANVAIAGTSCFYLFTLLLQIGFYAIATVGYLQKMPQRFEGLSKLTVYFIMANLAILKAWGELIIGKRYKKWQPTKR